MPEWARQKEADDRLELSLAEIELPVRTVNCLEDEGILTVKQLLNCQPQRLLTITNFGEKTLDQVYDALEKVGFYRPTQRPLQQGGLKVVSDSDHVLLDD